MWFDIPIIPPIKDLKKTIFYCRFLYKPALIGTSLLLTNISPDQVSAGMESAITLDTIKDNGININIFFSHTFLLDEKIFFWL